jgi:hypothetical protein
MSVALDYASDDDEAGVFFGAHNPVERKIAASLSRSIPASPASCSLAALAAGPGSGSGSGSASSSVGPRAPRRSSIRFKRDSCEVLRRRTPADDKEDEAGPSRLAQSHVHDRTPTPEDDTMEDGMFLDDADTDKENSIVPDPYYGSDVEDEYSPAEVEEAKPITLGFHGRQDGELS